MFGVRELVLGCLYAFGFVGMFALQRVISPCYYFGAGELVCGLRTNIRPLALVIRVALIVAFSVFAYSFSGSLFPVYYGVAMGSFLIVWPAVLEPDVVGEPRLAHRRVLLYTIYAVFIGSAVAFARVGVILQPVLGSWGASYYAAVREPGWLIRFVGDLLLGGVLVEVLRRLMQKANLEVEWAEKRDAEMEAEWHQRSSRNRRRMSRSKLDRRRAALSTRQRGRPDRQSDL